MFLIFPHVSPRFLEYGEHKGNYYGMSLDLVRRVIAESKVCLLDVEPHVSKRSLINVRVCECQETLDQVSANRGLRQQRPLSGHIFLMDFISYY